MSLVKQKLSKKPYELSGWEDTLWLYAPNGDSGHFMAHLYRQDIKWSDDSFPAYDLDYLVWRIPSIALCYPSKKFGGIHPWSASSSNGLFAIADTPVDAVAELAIVLFEKGILLKEARP